MAGSLTSVHEAFTVHMALLPLLAGKPEGACGGIDVRALGLPHRGLSRSHPRCSCSAFTETIV